MFDTTVLIPIHRDKGNREWLQQTISSFPKDTPYLVLENDGEVCESLNVGLREAKTAFVIPFGADDLATPDMLHELHAAIWDVDVAYPEMLLVSENLTEPLGLHQAQPFCPHRLEQGNFVTGNSLIRREKALAAGGYRDLVSLEDWDLFVRMARMGCRFKGVPTARMLYRQVEGSRNKNPDIDWQALVDSIVGEDRTADMAATFYFSPTPAVAQLRCILPAKHLPGVAREGLEIGIGPNGEHAFVGHRGAAVFQFGANKSVATIALQMRADGIRVLIETDDNYVAGGAQAFRKKAQWGVEIGDRANTVQGHRSIVGKADGVIVTTDYLASQYRKINPNVFVCPNQIDPVDWQLLSKPDDGIFRIGWFASASHAGDGVLIRRAMEWASRQKDVEVVTLGFDPGWKFKYTRLPWATDMSAYRKAMQYLDVGLAPIVPSPFTRGRSDLKWLEYSMAGAASIVSDVDCYDTVPAGLAFKARDAHGFYAAVRDLVGRRDEAKQMAAAAREYVLRERTMAANIWRWQEAIAA